MPECEIHASIIYDTVSVATNNFELKCLVLNGDVRIFLLSISSKLSLVQMKLETEQQRENLKSTNHDPLLAKEKSCHEKAAQTPTHLPHWHRQISCIGKNIETELIAFETSILLNI